MAGRKIFILVIGVRFSYSRLKVKLRNKKGAKLNFLICVQNVSSSQIFLGSQNNVQENVKTNNMPLFTIFKTEEEKTKVVGQTSKEGFHQQKVLVEKITGEKPKSGIITENTSTFNVGDVKIDFINKDSLGGELPI